MAFNAIRRALGTLGDAAAGKAPDGAKDEASADDAASLPSPQFAEMYRSIDAAFISDKEKSGPSSFLAARAGRDAGWTAHGANERMSKPANGRQAEYERRVMSAAPYRAMTRARGEVDPETLFAAAREAMRESHSPYSQFPVGAAILSESGAVHSGCNVENASYPEGWCAETSAIAHMIRSGDRKIVEIAVVAEKMPGITPCGGCRQRILEFGSPGTVVHLCDASGIVESVTLAELLPRVF